MRFAVPDSSRDIPIAEKAYVGAGSLYPNIAVPLDDGHWFWLTWAEARTLRGLLDTALLSAPPQRTGLYYASFDVRRDGKKLIISDKYVETGLYMDDKNLATNNGHMFNFIEEIGFTTK